MELGEQGRLFVYRSPLGRIGIREDLHRENSWVLCFEIFEVKSSGERRSSIRPTSAWRTAEAAAAAVREQRTRFPLWDRLPYVVYPARLDDWQEAPSERVRFNAIG